MVLDSGLLLSNGFLYIEKKCKFMIYYCSEVTKLCPNLVISKHCSMSGLWYKHTTRVNYLTPIPQIHFCPDSTFKTKTDQLGSLGM